MHIIGILPAVLLVGIATELSAHEPEVQFTAALKHFQTGDLDAALRDLDALLDVDGLDQSLRQRIQALAARVLQSRGEENFRHARILESLADFDRQVELQPHRVAEHWQRGIVLYYAGAYEKGVRQFEVHRTVNPQDVENAVWHFLCVVRAPGGSMESARKKLIEVTRDSRAPMAQIHKLFAGKMKPEEVLQSGEDDGDSAKFYADLYVGLYYEALGRGDESLRLIAQAAANPASRNNYMGDVARTHLTLRKNAKASPKAQGPNVTR